MAEEKSSRKRWSSEIQEDAVSFQPQKVKIGLIFLYVLLQLFL